MHLTLDVCSLGLNNGTQDVHAGEFQLVCVANNTLQKQDLHTSNMLVTDQHRSHTIDLPQQERDINPESTVD